MIDKKLEQDFFDNLEENLNKADIVFKSCERDRNDTPPVPPIVEYINEVVRLQMEYKERTLAEIITNYDFIVGSEECKLKLIEALPEGENIICSPHIASPTMIYAIKKFDILDLLKESYKSEE